MTVPTTTSRADYTGNGSTTAWTVPFYFLDPTHLQVIRTQISTAVSTTLTLSTDYTVTGAGVPAGGTVTTVATLTTDQRITILRNVPFTQMSHYVLNDPFPAATHEQIVDQLTMEVQQLYESVGRALTLPSNSSGVSTALATPVANNLIGWNATATALQSTPLTSLATAIVATTWTTQRFSGTGSTTAFVLGAAPGSTSALIVSVGGSIKVPSVDFTVSGTTLTFTAAPASGTNNIAVQYGQSMTTLPTSDLSAPGTIGGSIPGAATFTTLTVNGASTHTGAASFAGAVSGAGITSLLASPSGPIGTGTPAGGRFTFAHTAKVDVTFSATAMTVDCSLSNVFATTFTANVTIAPTVSNAKDGQTINWFITQDGTGSRTMTWPTSFKWPGGSAGVLSTAAGAVDLLVATYRSDTGFWYATLSKAFS